VGQRCADAVGVRPTGPAQSQRVVRGLRRAAGEHLTRYLNRENPINQALLEKGKGDRALDKVLDAAKADSSVYYVEASISPNGVEIGKVRMGVSTASVGSQPAGAG